MDGRQRELTNGLNCVYDRDFVYRAEPFTLFITGYKSTTSPPGCSASFFFLFSARRRLSLPSTPRRLPSSLTSP